MVRRAGRSTCNGLVSLICSIGSIWRRLRSLLVLLTCPDGYCCGNRSDGCAWDSDDACLGDRSHSYPLCGGCKHGFSQAIDGVGCVENSSCGGGRG